MIGNTTRGSCIWGLVEYLTGEPERVAWTHVQGEVVDPSVRRTAHLMEYVASQSRAEKYVYHLSLSLPPGETLSRDQWLAVSERILEALGVEEHQVLMVAHNDTDHQHVHLAINRVHPETRRAAPLRDDYRTIEQECRRIERDFGLQATPGHHGRLAGQQRPLAMSPGEWTEPVRLKELRAVVRPHLERSESWAELLHGLSGHGLAVQPRGGEFVLTDGTRSLKASQVDRRASRSALEKRFGPFETWRNELDQLAQAIQVRDDRLAEWKRLAGRLARSRQLLRGKLGPVSAEQIRAARREIDQLPGRLGKLAGPATEVRQLRQAIVRLGGRPLVDWARSQAASLLIPQAVALTLSLAKGNVASLVPAAIRLAQRGFER